MDHSYTKMAAAQQLVGNSTNAAAPIPSESLHAIIQRTARTVERLQNLNSEMINFRGSLFGEGEPSTEGKVSPQPAGIMGQIAALFDHVDANLDQAERQFGSIRRLG